MSKKQTKTVEEKPVALIVDKVTFKDLLNKQIELGKKIYNSPVTTVEQLEINESEYKKWNDYNSELLKQKFNIEYNEYKSDYDDCTTWVGMGPITSTSRGPNEKLKNLKEKIKLKIENLEQLRDKTDLLKSDVQLTTFTRTSDSSELIEITTDASNKQVFIVHGHNESIKLNVARTLEKLGLIPIILHEQPNEGRTIIEKFEKHSKVGFAVVLLTDDDEGKSKTTLDLQLRARQNVILELGYFIGKLGRERVVPLYMNDVELPSDLYGLVYVPIDSTDSWKFALVKELRAAGYTIDANKII